MNIKLNVAMKEIENVMRKHDLGGFVAIHHERETQYQMFLEPSWSLVRIMGENRFHIKLHASKQPYLDYTGSFLYSMKGLLAWIAGNFGQLCSEIERHAEVKHEDFHPSIVKPPED